MLAIIGKAVFIDGQLFMSKSNDDCCSQSAAIQKENDSETAAAVTTPACGNYFSFPNDAETTEDGAFYSPECYEDLMLADSPETAVTGSSTEAVSIEDFSEDEILKSTDIFVEAIVESISVSADGASYIYEIKMIAVHSDNKNEAEMSIIVSENTAYPLRLNHEYLLPLKKTENTGYELVCENAPQIEFTLDRRLIFHDGWKTLDVNASPLIYPKSGENDAFYDKMRISDSSDISELLNKWKTLQEE
jgi:hypothetical protein